MPKVIIPQDAGHDYIKAEKYGELTPYIVGPVNAFSVGKLDEAKQWLDENFKKEDYILAVGNITLNCTMVHHILMKHGSAKLLLFHNKELQYKLVEIYK